MSNRRFPTRNKISARTGALKDAIVACFFLPDNEAARRLGGYDSSDWESALWWIDISGMALYFLDRAQRLNAQTAIAPIVEAALVDRRRRNRLRVKALHQEAAILSDWLRIGHVSYALLKGISLVPDSVPDATLRSQTDLDFLVAERHVALVRYYLRRLGYKLHAQCENTLEFRAGSSGQPDILNMYSPGTQRALELHVVPENDADSGLLERRVSRQFSGANIHTLSPADVMVHQAIHLLKHLCGEHTRLSWVLEFRRHLESRKADVQFWHLAQSVAAHERNGDIAMGTALWLVEEMFGKLDLDVPPQWQPQRLPAGIRLWLQRYAREVLLSDSTGTKLYVLLRDQMPCASPDRGNMRKILLPLCLPFAITSPTPDESLRARARRFAIEVLAFLQRLRFHIVEDIHFSVELVRWKRALTRCGQ